MDTYTPPVVTVDTVLFAVGDDGELVVLLNRRAADPYKGRWALPGVYMAAGETIGGASDRCLRDKTGVAVPDGAKRRTITVYDSIGRDPRGPSLSIVHLALTGATVPLDGKRAVWRPVADLGRLAFDHEQIIGSAAEWARQHLWTDPDVFAGMLPAGSVSMSDVLRVVAAVDGPQDPSNVRRRALTCGMFHAVEHPTGSAPRGRGRPATVLAFDPRR